MTLLKSYSSKVILDQERLYETTTEVPAQILNAIITAAVHTACMIVLGGRVYTCSQGAIGTCATKVSALFGQSAFSLSNLY